MKVRSAKFLTSAVRPDQYPRIDVPRIAFAGRSNVGKSSLINSLTGCKGLSQISKTPGKTRLLNFFLAGERLMLVDMPGYGYASVPLSEKKKWGKMVETYLREDERLKALILLLDCRRTPNDDDRAMLDWLAYYNVPVILVITKIDKIPKTRRLRRLKEIMEAISDMVEEGARPVLYSSNTGEGKRELWAAINEAVGGK